MSKFYRGFASAFLFGSLIQYWLDMPIAAIHSVGIAAAAALLSLAHRAEDARPSAAGPKHTTGAPANCSACRAERAAAGVKTPDGAQQ